MASSDDKRRLERVVGEYLVTVHPRLGNGSFGIVSEAFHLREKKMYAIKEMGYKDLTKKQRTELLKLVSSELDTLSKVQDHPNIVQLKEHFDSEETHWIVMEYCDKGDLKQYLDKNHHLTITELLRIMHQLSTALCFMHSQKPAIVHRDIKLLNILIKTERNQVVSKLCDFGFAKFHERYSTMSAVFKHAAFMHSLVGSPPFMAPEFWAELEGGPKYTAAADVFSMGLVFQVMINPDRDHYCPRSDEAREKGQDINIGVEMVRCYKGKKPLPTVIATRHGDDYLTKNIKRVIRHMTSFQYEDRSCMAYVAKELRDLTEGLERGVGDPDQQSSMKYPLYVIPLPNTDSENEVITDSNYVIMVAIVFGPAYSGYSFSFKNRPYEFMMQRFWGDKSRHESYMTPTSLLTDEKGRFIEPTRKRDPIEIQIAAVIIAAGITCSHHQMFSVIKAFGNEAEIACSEYPDAAENTDSSGNGFLFKRLCMDSYSSEIIDKYGRHAMLTATDGKYKLPAIEVFGMGLAYMKDQFLHNLNNNLEKELDATKVRWVLTVPSNASDTIKRFMREAAVKGDLVDNIASGNLVIVLESDAASQCCRSKEACTLVDRNIEHNVTLDEGEIFMLVDAKEESTEITVHEMQANGDSKLLYIYGTPLGSFHVDEQLHYLFDEVFGEDIIADFRRIDPSTWKYMMDYWVTGKIRKSTLFTLEYCFHKFVKDRSNSQGVKEFVRRKPESGISYSRGRLTISAPKQQSMFDHVLDPLTGHITGLLNRPELKNVKCIYFVGDFAETELLQEKMKKEFSSSVRSVLIPEDASICVIQGAVLYGHRLSTM